MPAACGRGWQVSGGCSRREGENEGEGSAQPLPARRQQSWRPECFSLVDGTLLQPTTSLGGHLRNHGPTVWAPPPASEGAEVATNQGVEFSHLCSAVHVALHVPAAGEHVRGQCEEGFNWTRRTKTLYFLNYLGDDAVNSGRQKHKNPNSHSAL